MLPLLAHEDRSDVPRFFGRTAAVEFSWPHVQHLDAAGLASLVFSRSYVPQRESAAGAQVAARVGDVFRRFASDAAVAVRYRTVLIVGRPS